MSGPRVELRPSTESAPTVAPAVQEIEPTKPAGTLDLTVRDLLADSDEELSGAIESAVFEGDTPEARERTARVAEEVGQVIGSATSDLVSNILVDGWRQHAVLTEAARRSLETRGAELVAVGSHEIIWSTTPSIRVTVAAHPASTVEPEITAGLLVSDLNVSISGGRITAVHSGTCSAHVTMTGSGRVVYIDRSRSFAVRDVFSIVDISLVSPMQR